MINRDMRFTECMILLCLAFVWVMTGNRAEAVIISFEDAGVPGPGHFNNGAAWVGGSSTGQYDGFTWQYFAAVDYRNDLYFKRGRVSGNVYAYNGGGAQPATISANKPFDFNGAWLTGGWNDNGYVRIDGLTGGNVVYSHQVTVDYDKPTWFDFSFWGVTELRFYAGGGTPYHDNMANYFIVDDIAMNEPHGPMVPEPATSALFALGLMAVAGFFGRSKNGCGRGHGSTPATVRS